MPLFSPYITLFKVKKSIIQKHHAKLIPYKALLGAEKDDIGHKNAYIGDVNI
jgi:hypothetical protein